jgi:hypothetical protein
MKQRVEKSRQSFDEKDVWVRLCSISFRSLLELGAVHKDTNTHPFLFTIVMEGYSYGSVTDRNDKDVEEQPMTATESGNQNQTRPDQTPVPNKGKAATIPLHNLRQRRKWQLKHN